MNEESKLRLVYWLFDHRWRLVMAVVLPLVLYWAYDWLAGQYQDSLGVEPQHAYYDIQPAHDDDDTLRVCIIGDSWAEYHTTLACDTIFCRMARRLTRQPVKCFSTGHSGKPSRAIYTEMFADRTVEFDWERSYCSQPLIEQHPDYCVVMAGINDMRLYKPTSYYTGNYLLILRHLLHHGIRPVVMEMPDVDFELALRQRPFTEQAAFAMLSWLTKTDYRSAPTYREAMRQMLATEGLRDSVLFIPVDHWNAGGVAARPAIYLDDRFHLNLPGYRVLDSCMATEIIRDYELRKKQNK